MRNGVGIHSQMCMCMIGVLWIQMLYTYDWRVIIMLDLPMCTSVCMCVWERCVGIIGIYEVVVFFVYTYVWNCVELLEWLLEWRGQREPVGLENGITWRKDPAGVGGIRRRCYLKEGTEREPVGTKMVYGLTYELWIWLDCFYVNLSLVYVIYTNSKFKAMKYLIM